ncbi:HlyD family efflux transporter periplasmic adaptor subunit, partial [Nostoc sp.]|uniref:HlyD family efflux transporter periplasmic adaptor subunit n=1 Tax=Nostoc sp. TaxID=1180 RepID=UPI002FF7766D
MTNVDISFVPNSHSFPKVEKAIPQPEEINLNSLAAASPEDFLPPIGKWTTIGGLILIATFVAGVTLASILKYKTTVKVAATIRPAGELRLVQAATEGIIKDILVKGNQQVKQGDIIAILDGSRLQTKKSQLLGNIQQTTVQSTQITAQISALDRQIQAENEQTNRATSAAQAELQRTQMDYRNSEISTSTEVEELVANLKLVQDDLETAKAELKSAQASSLATQASFKAAIVKRDRYKPIVKSGALSQDAYEEVTLAVQQQQQAFLSQLAIVEAHKQTVEKQQRAVEAAQARLKKAKTTLNSIAGVAIARERIAQEKARGEATLSRLQQEREQLIQRRTELENQLNSYQKELKQIEIELQNIIIRASASGTIAQLNLRNVSQVISSGQMIAQIAPSEAPLEIKADIPAEEISKIRLGQKVYMRVSACPYPDYGSLQGTVNSISPDAIEPQSNFNSSNSSLGMRGISQAASYKVNIKPENYVLKIVGKECAIQLGMEGSADIISKEETVLQFILRKARLYEVAKDSIVTFRYIEHNHENPTSPLTVVGL